MYISGILDPAPSEATEKRQEPHARNALLVEGIDCWGRRFILHTYAIRADYRDVIDEMFKLAKTYSFNTWLVEEVNFSNVYRHWIADDQRPGGRHADEYMRVVKVEPGKRNKDTRITDKLPGWRAGEYYINREGTEAFCQEFDEYPSGLTKDLLDAMGYDHKMKKPESPGEFQKRVQGQRGGRRRGNGTIDDLTGY